MMPAFMARARGTRLVRDLRQPRLALALALLLGGATTGAQVPVFPAQTERVIVDVVVTDADGKPIAGLTREDFVVEDEGSPQSIEEFEAVDVSALAAAAEEPADARTASSRIASNRPRATSARSFLIVFDDLNLTPASAEKASQALRRFLEVQLRDSDCVTLAPTAGGAWWSGCLATDRADLAAALRTLRGQRRPDLTRERMSDYEAMRIEVDRDRETMTHVAERYVALGSSLTSGSTTKASIAEYEAEVAATVPLTRTYAARVYAQVKVRNERTLAFLERGIRALAGGRGRRVVVLASDGFVHDHRLPGFRRVREAARRTNAALYFVDADVDAASHEMTSRAAIVIDTSYASVERRYAAEESGGAEALAADTGGLTVRGTDLHRGLAQIAAESRAYYLLGYAPSHRGKDGRFRKIKVSVRRPGARVRARSGYYPGPAPADEPAAGALPPQVRLALDGVDGARGLSLRLMPHVLGNVAGGRVAVVLSAEVDPGDLQFEPKEGRVTGVVQSFSTVAALETGELGQKDLVHDLALRPEALPGMATTWVPLTHVYELPPGRYQAQLVALDRASGRTGSVRQSFDVPALGDLRLATPVLTDMLAPGGPDGTDRPMPVARRAFTIGSRLVCGVEVWGGRASPESSAVDIVYEVRRADGSVVARTNPKPLPRDAAGGRADQFKLTLNRAGAYELRLRARDLASGEEAVASEHFEVGGTPPPH